MAEKAQAVLRKMQKRRALKRLDNAARREKNLCEFNASTLDPVGPIDQSMAVPKEMNDLEARHDGYVETLVPLVGMH